MICSTSVLVRDSNVHLIVLARIFQIWWRWIFDSRKKNLQILNADEDVLEASAILYAGVNKFYLIWEFTDFHLTMIWGQ